MKQLILASQSPRRRELLQQAGFKFTVSAIQISEIPDENLSLEAQIQQLSLEKAQALVDSGKLSKGHGFLLLSADTVVVLGDRILGKPANKVESAEYLRQLSGRKHRVITAVCLWDLDSGLVKKSYDQTWVTFRKLNDQEIESYAASGEGLDKAGGYGIQGAASSFVANVEGAMDTVVGLPVSLVERLMKENGWTVDRD
jgi:septum formation protein